MEFEVQTTIRGSKEDVWRTITDIENCTNTISAIEYVEILEKPAAGFIGLKWKETRTMFGKSATEVMWITEASENEFYNTRAESHGSVYHTRLAIQESGEDCVLSMKFRAAPQNLGAKIMAATMGVIFKKATVNALQGDLNDIKAAVEKSTRAD